MPLASGPGAPRPNPATGKAPLPNRRRCLGVLTPERIEQLHASGGITDAEYTALKELAAAMAKRAEERR